jgi:oxygen-independent coproporphyrinogen-3 oxidase
MLELPPLSLYVHLPWCVAKCPYCDFNSYETRGPLAESDYVAALLRDLDSEVDAAAGRELVSVFFGGGTPSLFSGESIDRLMRGIGERLRLAPETEVTLEANPGAVEAGRFAEFRAAGVGRLSIGIQSLRDAQLRTLGRVHDAAEAMAAVEAAQRAGFDNLNLDLMYGLPGDDPDGAVGDLAAALALGPTHLSWYQLTLEPGTAFARKPPPLPDEDCVIEIETAGRALLAASGFERYEISAYARPGRRSVHNLNYWRFGDYLGIGAGAHGKLTRPAEERIERRSKTRNPRSYMAQAGTAAAVSIDWVGEPDQLALEFLMNALRLPEGIELASFEARTGQTTERIEAATIEAARRGWLHRAAGRLQPTAAGLQSLNRLLALF